MRKGMMIAALVAIGATSTTSTAQQAVNVMIGPDGAVSVNGVPVGPGGRAVAYGQPPQRQQPRYVPTLPYPSSDEYEAETTPRSDMRPLVLRRRGPDQHFVLDLVVNGVTIKAVVDTGARNTFMTTRDAMATGAMRNVVDAVPAYGIAGSIMTNRVRLDQASVHGIDLGNPLVMVGQGINVTLLGLPQISRLGRIEIDGDRMTITPRARG